MLFQVNIQVYSSLANNIVNYYATNSNCDKTIDVISFETDTSHIHYEALVRQNCNQECTFHCSQVAISLNMVDGVNYHMITGTLNPTCKNNRIMLSTHVLEQHHHALGRHFIRKTMLTNNNDGFSYVININVLHLHKIDLDKNT
jgi:hypothetical protein